MNHLPGIIYSNVDHTAVYNKFKITDHIFFSAVNFVNGVI